MKYMEKKNMVLLTVIAVATLLVAVVGATFAYFTAQSTIEGNETTTSATTRQLAALSWSAGESGKSPEVYPGYMAYQAYELKATGNGSANYKLTLDATVDPAFNAIEEQKDLVYSIYKTTTSKPDYGTLFQPGDASVQTLDNTTTYKIAGAGFTSTSLTSVVAEKPLTTGSGQEIVANATINGDSTEYYVLVIYFKESGAAQNDLQGKTFSAALKLTAIATR